MIQTFYAFIYFYTCFVQLEEMMYNKNVWPMCLSEFKDSDVHSIHRYNDVKFGEILFCDIIEP